MKFTIQDKINHQFNTYKDNTAIIYNQNLISYFQLSQKSDMVARQILKRGIERATFIAILMEDKAELIATIIGILKAGCVFVPLDSRQPVPRMELMLNSTDTRYVFIDDLNYDKLSSQFVNNGGKIEPLRVTEPDFDLELKPIESSLEDPIYVYFTSGTTGDPKAIVGKNKSLLHFIDWEIKTFNINADFRVSLISSVGFDASLRDIFVPLCSGGTICIPENRDEAFDSHNLIDWIEKEKINLIHCTPSIFRQINADFLNRQSLPDLKYILLAFSVSSLLIG